jgi:hypothetical protein
MSLVLNSGMTLGPGFTADAGFTPPPVVMPVQIGLRLQLDVGDTNSYPGPQSATWTDTVSSIPFTLYGSPTYSASNGGYLEFVPASSQYAQSSTGPGLLSTWTVEVWHYYSGIRTGGNPCLISEIFTAGQINYVLGSFSSGDLQAGFFNGGFHATSGQAIASDQWLHIIGSYDGTDVKLYVNGALVQTSNDPGQTVGASNGGINLMRRWDNPDLWGGRLSVVRIYDTALDLAGVTQNFTADRARFGL